MADLIAFNVALPAPPAELNDIASGELTVSVDGEVVATTPTQLSDTEVGPFEGPQDATVDLSYVYIDDAGNKSQPSTAQFQLVDTVPPPAPGQLGVEITGERHVADEDPGTPSETPSETPDTPDEPTESPSESA